MPSTPTLAPQAAPVCDTRARARTPSPCRSRCTFDEAPECSIDSSAVVAVDYSACSTQDTIDVQWSAVSRDDYSVCSTAAPERRTPQCSGGSIVTPWFITGVARDAVTLADEVANLHALLHLAPTEREYRKGVRTAVQEVVQRHWHNSTVKVYGSFAYDCSLPDSALDLVVEGCGDRAGFQAVLADLSARNLAVECQFEGSVQGVQQGFAKLRSETGVVANVSFVGGRSPVRQGVTLIRKLITAFPAAPAVFAAVRLVLQQVRCADVASGGLPAYAVLLMVMHAAHHCSNPADPGQLLVDFFTIFGTRLSYKASATAPSGAPCPEGVQLYVEDPVGGANVTADCKRIVQVRSIFQHCGQVLARWNVPRPAGYRGRTPLSSILAYDALWDRAHSKRDGCL
eukprot:TRINITY_DN327_c0_g1_i1.p1 TRINITY_DN327_c0_g1~~TRINITY_DN327_c0_g1_i1.p1  ORF type:complete len:399 (+),score=115.39 TRINITY_DN327_c0_g1_i1:87-1283(+)